MKLYKIDYSYIVEGSYKTFFTKKIKPSKANIGARTIYIKCEENEIEEKLKKIAHNKMEEWQQEIDLYGYIHLHDWTLTFVPAIKFDKIDKCSNIEFYYKEATIQECFKRLSPTEYNEMYGNILKVGRIDD